MRNRCRLLRKVFVWILIPNILFSFVHCSQKLRSIHLFPCKLIYLKEDDISKIKFSHPEILCVCIVLNIMNCLYSSNVYNNGNCFLFNYGSKLYWTSCLILMELLSYIKLWRKIIIFIRMFEIMIQKYCLVFIFRKIQKNSTIIIRQAKILFSKQISIINCKMKTWTTHLAALYVAFNVTHFKKIYISLYYKIYNI